MASAIKGIVSKNKIRYKEDGFDLDLSYISRNIIAMGFPAEKLERFYRNHIDDVVRFFESKHKDRYKLFNLCSENKRRYDVNKFQGRVDESFSFQDHHPPPFELLKPFCESVSQWIVRDKNNIAAIHCKAGKGRTGVMICAYLLHIRLISNGEGTNEILEIDNAEKALEYYGKQRTHDSKGVTIPSQRRYVYYYEELVKCRREYTHVTLLLKSIHLNTIPMINGGTFVLICDIIQLPKEKLKTYEIEVKRGSKFLHFNIPDELMIRGDIKIEFSIKKIKKEKIFQFCFNTFFVKREESSPNSLNSIRPVPGRRNLELPSMNGYANGQNYSTTRCSCRRRFNSGPPEEIKGYTDCTHIDENLTLVLPKNELDKAYKDKTHKIFSADFKVRLKFVKPVQQRSPDCFKHKDHGNCDNESSHDASSDNDSEIDTDEDDDDEDDDERALTCETTYL